MVSLRFLSTALLFTALINGYVFAENPQISAENFLALMQKNSRELTYQGSLIYSQDKQVESIKIHHAFQDGVQFERLEYLSGAPRVMIRRGDKVFFVNSKVGVIHLLKPLPLGSFTRDYYAQLGINQTSYQVQLSGKSRVAGRSVQLLTVQAQDSHRFGFNLALDEKTGLLLRSLMVGQQGEILERFEYTDIIIGKPIAGENFAFSEDRPQFIEQETDAYSPQTIEQKRLSADLKNPVPVWTVGWLPADFRLLDSQSHQQAVSDLKATMRDAMMYSDGLTAFSIFVANGIDMGDFHLIQKGATTAYSAAKKDSSGIYTVTVVGEIPTQTAKQIATSVRR